MKQTPFVNTVAPLTNVALFSQLVERVVNRQPHLPGLATFHGFSGFGKTKSAIFAANQYRAIYVEVGATWTQKKFCQALCHELGLETRGTIADLVERIIGRLVMETRPVIIDEFDHLVKRNCVDLVREIHDKTQAAIILIGEEQLPQKLQAHERFHNRMLDWVAAEPASIEDAEHLARLYCKGLTIQDDLLKTLYDKSGARVRRIIVNLERVREFAQREGLKSIGVSEWQTNSFFTGQPPARRVA